jgi:hypothetical protein
MTPEETQQAADAFALVGEILDARAGGDFDTTHGNSDDDLLAALEALEPELKRVTAEVSG